MEEEEEGLEEDGVGGFCLPSPEARADLLGALAMMFEQSIESRGSATNFGSSSSSSSSPSSSPVLVFLFEEDDPEEPEELSSAFRLP